MKCINANDNQKSESYMCLPRRSLINLIGSLTIGMILWICACDHSNADSASKTENMKESKMESIASDSTIKAGIPPIDTAAPAETSTATFALG